MARTPTRAAIGAPEGFDRPSGATPGRRCRARAIHGRRRSGARRGASRAVRREPPPRARRPGRYSGARSSRASAIRTSSTSLRSAVKPFAWLRWSRRAASRRINLTDAELAVMAASHTGEDAHVRTVQAVLRRSGLSQALLAVRHRGRAGRLADRAPASPAKARRPDRSATCAPAFTPRACCSPDSSGWSLADYWRPDHPSQLAARRDGCPRSSTSSNRR